MGPKLSRNLRPWKSRRTRNLHRKRAVALARISHSPSAANADRDLSVARVAPAPRSGNCVGCGHPTFTQPERIEIPEGAELPLGFGVLEGIGFAVTRQVEAVILREATEVASVLPVFRGDGTEASVRQLVVSASLQLHAASFFPKPICPLCGSGGGLQERRMVLDEPSTYPSIARAGQSRFHLLVRDDVLVRFREPVPQLPAWHTYWVGERLPTWTFEGEDLSDCE